MAKKQQLATVDICHLASAHERNDTRIGVKMARSAIDQGLSVAFVVADDGPDEMRNGMLVVGVKRYRRRLLRMLFGPISVYRAALRLNARIYKLHDPELLLMMPFIKLFSSAKFVFDSHEDVPIQFLAKPYLNPILRRVGSLVLKGLMHVLCSRLDGVIAATPFIRDKLKKANSNTIDICNYPISHEMTEAANDVGDRLSVTYIGNIGESRGIFELLKAMEYVRHPVRLELVGSFNDASAEARARAMPGWKHVTYHGWVGRDEVVAALKRSVVGIVVLRPHPNYVDALPVKMFEYMGGGVPVIASDFPLWRKIVEDADCGLLVDPLNPKEIAEAIDVFHEDKSRVAEMGRNGSKAALAKYNWGVEEGKLISFYRGLLEAND